MVEQAVRQTIGDSIGNCGVLFDWSADGRHVRVCVCVTEDPTKQEVVLVPIKPLLNLFHKPLWLRLRDAVLDAQARLARPRMADEVERACLDALHSGTPRDNQGVSYPPLCPPLSPPEAL